MHSEAKLGNSFCSKLVTFRFSSGFLLVRGAVGFLKGSIPSFLEQVWQRNPGGEFAATV